MTNTTYTPEVRAKLEDYLATHELPAGLGDEDSACSIAAINLALSGELTDDIPECMSEVLGKATITLQDTIPADMRNSDRYKAWLPTAAGTGREYEQERLDVLLEWLWETVLPQLQGWADETGFGKEWKRMGEERTEEAARVAARALAYADDAAYAARVAARALAYADDAAYAACAAAGAAAHASRAAAYAPRADDLVARAPARDAFWQTVDPIGVLERMTKIGELK